MSRNIPGSAGRFLIVGTITVFIDLATYGAFALAGMAIDGAKGIGFLVGTLFAYFANRHYTFRAKGGGIVFFRFLCVYAVTLVCNVAINHAVLAILQEREWAYAAAFLVATVVSAALNFIGMRSAVFCRSEMEL